MLKNLIKPMAAPSVKTAPTVAPTTKMPGENGGLGRIIRGK